MRKDKKWQADDLCAVEAENSINYGVAAIIRNKLLGNRLRLGKTSLLSGYVDIIVNMAVAGCKMSLGYAKEKILVSCSYLCSVNGRHGWLRSKAFYLFP